MSFRFSRLLIPVAIAACVAFAADISTDYDHHADFSRYHTYSWIGVRAGNSLWQERIMQAVDNALMSRGWTKRESGGDASVSAFGRTQEQDTLQTFYDGFPGWGWRGWGGMGTATTSVVPERIGTLNVDIFDGNTKQLIWRGTAQNTLSSKPEQNDKKMEKSVEEMFKHFPPASKG
jgi:Domain of unknown function (DUF4136)